MGKTDNCGSADAAPCVSTIMPVISVRLQDNRYGTSAGALRSVKEEVDSCRKVPVRGYPNNVQNCVVLGPQLQLEIPNLTLKVGRQRLVLQLLTTF